MLETLGGNTGILARSVGQTLQADAIVIPEIMISANEVATRLNEAVEQKGYGIGVINESVNTEAFREILESHLAYRVRYSQPSHAIRGCNPTFFDLTLAKMFAQHVTSLISQYKQSHVLLYQKGRVCSMPLSDFA
jgi:6-phosphofructokinase 1